jgi:DNA-binding winged helix-turn-helix (wHTH) protein
VGYRRDVLPETKAAEIDVRLRLVVGRGNSVAGHNDIASISLGALVMNEGTYTTRLHGHPILLTYLEFELLKYLVGHPGRVFTRGRLLQEVWGYDYVGGTRTVDVHVRRLRAKLGEYGSLIGTVRSVGYQAVRRNAGAAGAPDSDPSCEIGRTPVVHTPVCAPSPPAGATTPAPPPALTSRTAASARPQP